MAQGGLKSHGLWGSGDRREERQVVVPGARLAPVVPLSISRRAGNA